MMQKILLTGINGQVGHVLKARLANDYALTAVSRNELDLNDTDAVKALVHDVQPDIIINPAAYTAVDKAESETDIAHAVNAGAPKALAEAGQDVGAALIHFSTDYVFDGSKTESYKESDTINPLGVYGKTKQLGEQAIQAVGLPHLILRTSWVYGVYGKNFFHTILRLAAEREELTIVGDQIGAPTSTLSIADGVMALLADWGKADKSTQLAQSGIYHFTNQQSGSWHDFAVEIVRLYHQFSKQYHMPPLTTDVHAIKAITTAEFPTPAARPANSRLNNAKLADAFGVTLPDWQVALNEVMEQYIQAKGYKLLPS